MSFLRLACPRLSRLLAFQRLACSLPNSVVPARLQACPRESLYRLRPCPTPGRIFRAPSLPNSRCARAESLWAPTLSSLPDSGRACAESLWAPSLPDSRRARVPASLPDSRCARAGRVVIIGSVPARLQVCSRRVFVGSHSVLPDQLQACSPRVLVGSQHSPCPTHGGPHSWAQQDRYVPLPPN